MLSTTRQYPLLVFLVRVTQSILLRQIAYLKAENVILRSRLSGHIQTTPAQRSVLVRLGAPLGQGIQQLLTIVHYKTFLRWVREADNQEAHAASRPARDSAKRGGFDPEAGPGNRLGIRAHPA